MDATGTGILAASARDPTSPRRAAELRLWPAINLNASGTRKEELLLSGKYLEGAQFLRRALAGQKIEDAAEAMIDRFTQTKNNEEFLKLLQR